MYLNIQRPLTIEPKLLEKTAAVLRRCQITSIDLLGQGRLFFILRSVVEEIIAEYCLTTKAEVIDIGDLSQRSGLGRTISLHEKPLC